MFRNNQLRKVMLCLGMEAAAFMGVPVRADEVEDLLRQGQEAKIEFTMGQESADSDDPAPPDFENGRLNDSIPSCN